MADDLDKAMAEADAAVKGKGDAPAFLARGELHAMSGNETAAMQDFNQAVQLMPGNGESFRVRAMSYATMKKTDNAIEDLNKAIELEPDSGASYYIRGALLSRQGKLKDALEDLRKAQKLQGDKVDAATYEETGKCLCRMGDLAAGYVELKKALDKEPTAQRYYHCGLNLSQRGKYADAVAMLDKAIELDPLYARALTERGLVHGEMNNLDKARADYDAAIKADANYFIAYANRAGVFVQLKMYKKAVADADTAIKLKPRYPLSYKLRAMAGAMLAREKARETKTKLQDVPEHKQAIADFEQYLQEAPDAPDAKWVSNQLIILKNGGKQPTAGCVVC